jgi:hypothetical protein
MQEIIPGRQVLMDDQQVLSVPDFLALMRMITGNGKTKECPRPDLNRRQPDLQSGALPS